MPHAEEPAAEVQTVVLGQRGEDKLRKTLLKLFFGGDRISALADMIQASLMLRYNKRSVGHAN